MDDGEVRHDGGHHRNLPNPSPGQIGWGTTEAVCERHGRTSIVGGPWQCPPCNLDEGVNNLPRRGVPRLRAPPTQEDGREQGAARRPDASGDAPWAEDGGWYGHPNVDGMVKRMEDEHSLGRCLRLWLLLGGGATGLYIESHRKQKDFL